LPLIAAGDVGLWNPFTERQVSKQVVPIGVAFRAFEKLDDLGQGFLRIASFVDGLLRYPKMADEMGLLSRSMRDDARELIYDYMYGSTDVQPNREVGMVEFVKIFSGYDLGWLHVQYRYYVLHSIACLV
jgi:hypothetical protein